MDGTRKRQSSVDTNMHKGQPQRTPAGRPWSFDRSQGLRIAMLMFWARGYANVSIADLTAAIGIRPTSLYAAYGSKSELYAAALKLYQETEPPHWTMPDDGPLEQRLDSIFEMAMTVVTRPRRPRGCMIASGFVEACEADEPLASIVRGKREEMRQSLQVIFELASERSELTPGASPEDLARLLATLLQGLSIQARDGANKASLRRVLLSAKQAIPFAKRSKDERAIRNL